MSKINDDLRKCAIHELEKFCHNKNCRFTEECPENHPKCTKELDSITPLAWELGLKLTRFCFLGASWEKPPKKETIKELCHFTLNILKRKTFCRDKKEKVSNLRYIVEVILSTF